MIKLFLMGIVVIVAAIGLGLGIQHVMAFGDCTTVIMTITVVITATVVGMKVTEEAATK